MESKAKMDKSINQMYTVKKPGIHDSSLKVESHPHFCHHVWQFFFILLRAPQSFHYLNIINTNSPEGKL